MTSLTFKYTSMFLFFDELSTIYYLGDIPKMILDNEEPVEIKPVENRPLPIVQEVVQEVPKVLNKKFNLETIMAELSLSHPKDMINLQKLSKEFLNESFFRYTDYITVFNERKSNHFDTNFINPGKIPIIKKIWTHIHEKDDRCCYVYKKLLRCKNRSISRKYICPLHNKNIKYSKSNFLYFLYKSKNFRKKLI